MSIARVASLRRWASHWGLRKLDELTVDTSELTDGHRHLAIAGYVATLGLLLASLVSGAFTQSRLAFDDYDGTHSAPAFLLAVVAATSVLGWAFLLTGASDAGRRVFLPLLLLCCYQLLSISAPGEQSVILVAGIAGLVVAVRGPTELWLRHPVGEFLVWVLILGGLTLLSYAGDIDPSDRLRSQYRSAQLLALLAIPLWIRLGRDAAQGGIDLGRSTARTVRRVLTKRRFLLAAAGATIAWPAVAGLLASEIDGSDRAVTGWLSLSSMAALPLCLWCVARVADGRWDGRAAASAVSLNVSFAALSLPLVSATYNTGLFERLVGSTNLVSPLFLFVVLATYDVVSFGAREAEREGRRIPRSGRVPVYFGALLLIVGAMLLLSGASVIAPDNPEVSVGPLPNGAFLFGIVFIGLPLYVKAVRRNRERFIASAGTRADELGELDAINGLGRPGGAVRAAWFFLAGWWLTTIVLVVAMLLAMTIVGWQWAVRLLDRLPTWLTLRARRVASGPSLSEAAT